jgi:hypothetical protein
MHGWDWGVDEEIPPKLFGWLLLEVYWLDSSWQSGRGSSQVPAGKTLQVTPWFRVFLEKLIVGSSGQVWNLHVRCCVHENSVEILVLVHECFPLTLFSCSWDSLEYLWSASVSPTGPSLQIILWWRQQFWFQCWVVIEPNYSLMALHKNLFQLLYLDSLAGHTVVVLGWLVTSSCRMHIILCFLLLAEHKHCSWRNTHIVLWHWDRKT